MGYVAGAKCPFCGVLVWPVAGGLSHGLPTCAKFEELGSFEFGKAAAKEQKRLERDRRSK